MKKKLYSTSIQKFETCYKGTIFYNDNVDKPDYDCFEIELNAEYPDAIILKMDNKMQTKAEAIRYLENLIHIIKTKL